ncbi:Do family serine endopeptidase (plasmid) [Sinorhizobium chiapasense]|uniref:Do family serine endopeptidase n=1 Tax=Sinorhizobium chiapasense TaxID=501572 RepID=UPI002FE04ECF
MFRNVIALRPAIITFCAVLVFAELPSSAVGQAVPGVAGELPTLAPVLERVTPAVVNISVVSENPYFRRFFDLPEAPRQRMSSGSGVILDAAKGHVLTNHHVVANAREITVTLKDGRRLRAELVGSDRATDIALLEVESSNLIALEIGDSDRLEVGGYVVAIGNPFGLGHTVTSGIVSALCRSGIGTEGYEDFIQTDASINPGNSGGPLVTLDGRLVGINTAILTPAGGNIGIGFAVPSNLAVTVMNQLIEHGEVRRGRLGIGIQDLTPDLAEALQLGELRGAVAPAEQAGLEVGDVVTAIDGHPVQGATDLRNRIGLTPVGSSIGLTIKRGDREQVVGVTIAAESGVSADLSGTPLDGARMRDASRKEAQQVGAGGIVIESVTPGSPAARAGLRQGDMIVAVNRSPVHSTADLRGAIAGARAILALELIRDSAGLLLVVR